MSTYMIEAEEAYENRNFDKAFELYKEEIAANPKNLLARDHAARCLLVKKDHLMQLIYAKK